MQSCSAARARSRAPRPDRWPTGAVHSRRHALPHPAVPVPALRRRRHLRSRARRAALRHLRGHDRAAGRCGPHSGTRVRRLGPRCRPAPARRVHPVLDLRRRHDRQLQRPARRRLHDHRDLCRRGGRPHRDPHAHRGAHAVERGRRHRAPYVRRRARACGRRGAARDRGPPGTVGPAVPRAVRRRVPVWVCSYRFRDKVYRFVVNARTGEVQGERPWSWIKITVAVLVAAAVIAALAAVFAQR